MVFVAKYTKIDVQKVGLSLAWGETGWNISPKIIFQSWSKSMVECRGETKRDSLINLLCMSYTSVQKNVKSIVLKVFLQKFV